MKPILGNFMINISQQLRNLFSNKHRIVFTWLLSYALVLLVPVLIITITYIKTVQMIQHEIYNSNLVLLKKVQQPMDGLIKDAVRLSQEIALDSHINDFLKTTDSIRRVNPYDTYLTVSSLKNYALLNNTIDDFYIYFKNSDLVLSSYSSSDNKSFYLAYFNNIQVPYQQWYPIVRDFYKGDFRSIPYVNEQGQISKKIVFIQTIPWRYQSGNSANIVVSIDESRFIEDARDIETLDRGTVLLLDQKNRVMASSHPFAPISRIKYHQFGNTGILRQKLNGEKVVISYITSQVTGWKYITIIPNRVFWKKAEYVRNLALFSLILCLLIGGLITIYALRKNYNPINQLIELLEAHVGLKYDPNNNEYQFIEQGLAKVHTDIDRADMILTQQNKVLRTNFLMRLFKGKEKEESYIQERLSLYDIHFKSDYFAIMAFYITESIIRSRQVIDERNESKNLEDLKQARLIMSKAIEGFISEKNVGLVIDTDDICVCLMNFPENETGEGKQEMSRVALAAQKLLKEQFKVSFMVSASNIHRGISTIPLAYHEALQAMEYKKMLGIEEFIHFEDINDLPKANYYYPLEKEKQLINCIQVGDLEKSRGILEEIFGKNFEMMFLPVKVARCLMFNLVGTMIKTINEENSVLDDDFLEKLSPVERLLDCENIAEMKQEMIHTLETFCHYIDQENREKKKNRNYTINYQLQEKIKEHIHEYYQDQNMGITTIAEHFKLHPITLSRIFMEQTGHGLLEYINRFRIKKAEELFKEGHNNLEDVAKAVGYYSIRTFTRAFKKWEGVTPGKFKEFNSIANQ